MMSISPESLVGDEFEPSPAILVVSEAVIPLALHHPGTFLVDKTDGEAKLSVDRVGVCRIKEH